MASDGRSQGAARGRASFAGHRAGRNAGTVPLHAPHSRWSGPVVSGGLSRHQPQAYYPRLGYKEALDFLETCQLGQTERGSFIATIMAPIPPQIEHQTEMFSGGEPQLALETEPFPRKATLRLMLALGHMSGSIHKGTYQSILNGVEQGVSANLCEAIVSMKPGGDRRRLGIRMSWSRNRPRVPASIATKVSFSQTAFSNSAGSRSENT